MGWLKRMSTSVSGPNLHSMRHLYLTSVRPIISYACAAWFTLSVDPDNPYPLKDALIQRLDTLQTNCLRSIAGAFKTTSNLPLHKELNIPPIAVYLQEKAMAHRARNYKSDDYKLLRSKTERFPHKATLNCFKRHPLLELYKAAGSLRDCAKAWWLDQNDTVFWENPVSQGEAITKYMKRQALLLCRELWEEFKSNEKKYRDTRIRKTTLGVQRRPVATMGDWGPRNLKRYRGLNRAQSTILIQMRTGFIGLNSFLYPKGVSLLFSPFLPLPPTPPCLPTPFTIGFFFLSRRFYPTSITSLLSCPLSTISALLSFRGLSDIAPPVIACRHKHVSLQPRCPHS